MSESLARFGVAGTVTVESNRAVLTGHGAAVSVDLGELLRDFHSLPHDLRGKRVLEVARRLAAERRTTVSVNPSSGAAESLGTALRVLAVALVGAGGWFGYRLYEKQEHAAAVTRPVIADYDAYERERKERAARVCDATRSRVMRGASIGPADVEGWVVELWALRAATLPDPSQDPALARFVGSNPGEEAPQIVWDGAPTLRAQRGPGTSVDIRAANLPEEGAPRFRGLRLVFDGHYVIPYFDEAPRAEYLKLARALTDAIGADHAALYARCAAGTSHHVGSWFRGPSPGGAARALLFFMGTFADHPDVAFESLGRATAALKKERVMTLLSSDGGMIAGLDGQVSTIAFPFRDSNRASRASHVIARELGIGEGR